LTAGRGKGVGDGETGERFCVAVGVMKGLEMAEAKAVGEPAAGVVSRITGVEVKVGEGESPARGAGVGDGWGVLPGRESLENCQVRANIWEYPKSPYGA
jgi:hypothetical protein